MKPLLYLLSLLAFVWKVVYKMEKKVKDRDFLGGHGRSLWLLQKPESVYINLANIKVTLKDVGELTFLYF